MKKFVLLSIVTLIFANFLIAQTELLSNPDFNNGTNGWWSNGADVSASNGKVFVNITNPGTNSWDIQLGQGGLTLKKDHKYILCWRAKRESGSLSFGVQLGEEPWTSYMNDTPDNFSDDWKENCIEYIHNDHDVSNIGITVNMGGNDANATFEYISLKEEKVNDKVEPIADFIGKSFSHPGNMELKNVPQFVCLSFDDNAFADGVEWLCKEAEDLKNPNGNNIGLSFYSNSTSLQTDKELVNIFNKYLATPNSPHELGNHTYDHPQLEPGRSVNEWKNIIQKGMDSLAHYTNISLAKLQQSGFRAPYLGINEELFTALNEMGIRYDHSTISYLNESNETGWPYMYKTNSSNESKSKFWKVPISTLQIPENSKVLEEYNIDSDIKAQVGGNMVSAGDYHLFDEHKLNSSSILGLLKYNLDLSLQSNKAPFTFCFHSHYYSAKHAPVANKNSNSTLAERQSVITGFIEYCQQKEDVYLTSVKRMLDWMETPINPNIALINPGVGPVSYYGKMQVNGSNIIGERTQLPMQVKGMSFFWSIWDGEKYWNANALNALVDKWQVEIVRAPMAVEAKDEWRDLQGYLDPKSKEAQIKHVETLVEAAIAKDIYVIIDFHSHEAHLHTWAAKEFFSYMAQKYGNYDNVIFEIYNEPAGPSYDERTTWAEIKSYAEEIIPEIRKHSENLIVVSPPWFGQEIGKAMADPLNDNNTCYTLHFYVASHKEDVRNNFNAAIDNGLAIFATEWGTVNHLGEGAVDYESSNAWMEFLDSHKISSANWSIYDGGEGASAFNPGISKTGDGWGEKSNLSPSGLYVYEMLAEHAKTAPWRKVTKIAEPEILATNPGAGPVSFYGEMQTYGNRIHGKRTQTPVQVKGLSLFWSIWGGDKFWNSGAINSLVDNWDIEIIRAPMSVEGNNGWDFGYLHANGKERQIALMEQVVEAAIARDIYVLIDYHAHEAHLNTEAAIEFFEYMAEKYGQYDNVIFEIYNEPQDADWPTIKVYAEQVIAEIRKYSDNLIVVGTPGYSQKVDDASLNPIDDPNTAYVFHFYANHLDDIRGIIKTALGNGIPLFATEWGNIYAYGDKEGRTDAQAFENSDVWHRLLDNYAISSAHWSVYVTDMTSEQPNEAAIFNSTFEDISTTGAGLGDTSLFTPSGLYTYKLLKEQAQKALWRKAEKQGYAINYHLNGDYNGANPVFYPSVLKEKIELKAAIKKGYEFGGWYTNDTFTGKAVTEILPGSTGEMNLYAKWIVPDSLELLSYPNFDFVTYGWNDQWREDSVSFKDGMITVHELTDNSGQLWKFVIQNNARFSLKQGKRYTLRWKAKRSDGEIQIEVKQANPFKTYMIDKKSFNGDWQEHELIYDHITATIDGIELAVLIGGYISDVSFDYISLIESDIKKPQYNISTNAKPVSGGTISGAGTYNEGEQVTLTATPSDGYEFVSWTLDGVFQSTDLSILKIVNEDATYVATFKEVNQLVDITFQIDMKGKNVSPAGIFLRGTFNDWTSNKKLQNDGTVYSTTLQLEPGTEILYKFVNGSEWENFNGGPCTKTTDFANRVFAVPEEDVLLEAVCFNSCDVCLSTSNDFIKESEIQIYPNPTSDFVYLTGLPESENSKIVVYDISGQILLQKHFRNQSQIKIDVNYLNEGSYFVSVLGNNKNKVLRFLKISK